MPRTRLAPWTTLVSILATAATGCASAQEAHRSPRPHPPQQSFVWANAPVKIRLFYDREGKGGRIAVEPEVAVLYLEPKDERKPSQVLWYVECKETDHQSRAEQPGGRTATCLRDGDELVVRPKEGCSKELFGPEIRIRRGHNAVASGRPRSDLAGRLMAAEKDSDKLCDGSNRAEREKESGMTLGRGTDLSWFY
jgi:hypothetical protein